MLTATQLQLVAQQMKAAQDEVRQIPPFSAQLEGFDLPSAYAVGELMHQDRIQQGAVPVGRKIGFTNPDMWAQYGVTEPIWAYIYDTTVVHSDREPRPCDISRFTEPKIEPEIVVHFHSAPPPGGDVRSIVQCVDWIAHGFEIVQSHFPGWKFQAADTVADWALHGTLLVGEPQPVGRLGPDLAADLERFSVSLLCDGALRETGLGKNVLGSPLLAIAHLLSVLSKHPEHPPLQAGELVTTGTITTAHPIEAGQVWRTEIQGIGLPGVAVEFVSSARR